MVGAGFCPLGELVQGDRYGRRPPGRSPGRAPLRGAQPPAEQRGPAADPLRPAQTVKGKASPAPPPCCPPCPCPAAGVCAAGWGRAFALWESWCRGIDTAAGRPGEARAGRPSGAPPRCGAAGACGRPPAPCTGCKKGKCPLRRPGKAPALFIGSAPAGRFFAPRGDGRNRMLQREALPPTH